ncbi:MAG: CBS domain-containing protein, partial [Chthoniobacterales bacterium]
MDLSLLTISSNSSIREALACINKNSKGIAMIIDERGHLLATITDGDIRRAILGGKTADDGIQTVFSKGVDGKIVKPITASQGISQAEILAIMTEKGIRQLPLINSEQAVVDVAFLQNILQKGISPV